MSLNWANINVVSRIALDEVLERHPQLFIEEHVLLQWTTAKIYVDTDAKPRFYKPQTVQCFLKDKIDREIERLQDQ